MKGRIKRAEAELLKGKNILFTPCLFILKILIQIVLMILLNGISFLQQLH